MIKSQEFVLYIPEHVVVLLHLPSTVFSACDCFSQYPTVLRPLRETLISGEAVCAGLLSHLSWEAALISKEAQHSGSWLQKEELWAGVLWPAVSSRLIIRIAATLCRLPQSLSATAALSARSGACSFWT